MRIGIISGAAFCIPLLHQLKAAGANVQLYFGAAPHPDKDRDGVVAFCTSAGIPIAKENNTGDLYPWIHHFSPDIIFVCGYAHKIKVKMCRDVRHGIYNIHFGKLPTYRGPNPVFWQLRNGEASVGLCIHELTNRFDAGSIVWQHEVRNESHFNYSLVNQLFANLQIQGVLFIISQLGNGRPLQAVKQDEKKVAYQARPTLNDVTINWQSMSSKRIINLIQACSSWNYGAITAFNGQEVKLLDAVIAGQSNDARPPGSIRHTDYGLSVACCDRMRLDIGFISVNGMLFHPRHAAAYGITHNSQFTT